MENQESGTKTTTHTTKMLIFKILNQHEQWCKCVLSITTEECEDFKTIQIKRVGTVLRYCVWGNVLHVVGLNTSLRL